MVPEKLEILDAEKNPEWVQINIAFAIDCHSKELAAEIVKRYNGYPDQQTRIEQLVNTCRKVIEADNSGKGVEWRDALASCQFVLAAAKEKE